MMATAVRERTAAGVPLGKIAVICRTNREIGPVIESFVKERIPYVSKEKADNVIHLGPPEEAKPTFDPMLEASLR